MSLQDLCLRKIVDDFERYHFAFATCKDENLLLKFEFLQRKYSLKIIMMLENDYQLNEEYFDLLLNKYLKELYSEWLINCTWEKISPKLSKIGPSLEKLHIADIEIPWNLTFCHFPNLKVVLFEENCSNTYLNCIARYCPNIEELDLSGSTEVNDDGISYLCRGANDKPACSFLKILRLDNTSVSDIGVKLLIKSINTLEEIEYQRLPQVLFALHEKDLKSLDNVQPYNITRLDLLLLGDEPCLSDIIRICVSVCPHLKYFSCPLLTQKHLDLCSRLSDIEVLHFKYGADSPLEIKNFLKLKGGKLTSLTLTNFKISVSDLAQNCHCLKKLWLKRISFEAFNDKSIPLFHNLETFTIESTEFTDFILTESVCKVMASSPKLEELSLQMCNSIPAEVKGQILKCCEQCSLTQIRFRFSVVEKELLREILLTCSTLEVLDVDGCDFDYSFVEDLNSIALSLPNRPEILCSDDKSVESNYDEFFNEFDDYDEYFDTDDEDVDSYYLDYDDDVEDDPYMF